MPLLQLEGVSKRFGQVVVADGITFQLEEGASVGVVGPNGAGKTSMFGIISGDIKADSGQLRFDDHDLAHVRRRSAVAWASVARIRSRNPSST